MRQRALLAAVLAASALAGCLTAPDAEGGVPACLPHPHPCGVLWPRGLEGPFQAQPRQAVEVASHDGTMLRGWLFLPQLPDGVRAPTLLVSSPYYGLRDAPPGDDPGGIGLTARYVEAGYAVAAFSVRGTGVSEGCFANKGLVEQLDQVALVDWAASQPWSNGRVAMGGTSYPGTTPFMAAIHGAQHLVTILPNGPVTDPYTELHTPQGALYTMGGPYEAGRRGLVTLAPQGGLQPNDGLPPYAQAAPDRLCQDVAQVLLGAQAGLAADDRDAGFWRERQLIRGFPNITAAVFLSHGLQETAHPFQEDIAWQALRNAPRRMLLGQWDHELPRVDDWQGEVLHWLDYWLKGTGTAEAVGVGTVRYQDDAGVWHETTQWPTDAVPQALGIDAGGELSGAAGASQWAGSFRSVPPPPRQHTGAAFDHLCGTGVPGTALVIRAAVPLAADEVVAGNPYLRLWLSADQPGGIVSAHLFAVPGEGCDGARLLTFGAADLRFHAGSFTADPFPVGIPVHVRIDLNNVAANLSRGERLALVLSYGDSLGGDEVADPLTDARVSRAGQPYTPLVTVHAMVAGESSLLAVATPRSMPGAAVPEGIPPRPFTPP